MKTLTPANTSLELVIDADLQPIGDLLREVDWSRCKDQGELARHIGLSNPGRWRAIRRLYELEQPAIDRGEYSPHLADWSSIFTPIEREMWDAIRCYGGLRFYPQYPVGRYFLDFADPWACIAIECDGAKYHNRASDEARDENLRGFGWRVYRIQGRDCFIWREGGRDRAFELLENIYRRNGGRYPDYSEDGGKECGL